jgi:hypothetical protein
MIELLLSLESCKWQRFHNSIEFDFSLPALKQRLGDWLTCQRDNDTITNGEKHCFTMASIQVVEEELRCTTDEEAVVVS